MEGCDFPDKMVSLGFFSRSSEKSLRYGEVFAPWLLPFENGEAISSRCYSSLFISGCRRVQNVWVWDLKSEVLR